jgi:DNA-binding transcriptional LysR family regulator
MHVFKTVVECGGFSAAQSELGVGRSTISRQVAHLETRFGFKLCYRGRSGFKVTQHGEQALSHINQLLAAASDFATNIAAINDDFVGKIDVVMIDSSFNDPKNPMLKAISSFRKLAPQVKINLAVQSPSEIERGILDGSYHLGLTPTYRQLQELSYQELYIEKVALFAGQTHPLIADSENDKEHNFEDVLNHELVFRGYLEGEHLIDIKKQFAKGPTVFQTESVVALVSAGAYLGFLPVHLTQPGLVNILPQEFCYSCPVSVVMKRSRKHSGVTRAFLDLLEKHKIAS